MSEKIWNGENEELLTDAEVEKTVSEAIEILTAKLKKCTTDDYFTGHPWVLLSVDNRGFTAVGNIKGKDAPFLIREFAFALPVELQARIATDLLLATIARIATDVTVAGISANNNRLVYDREKVDQHGN